MVGSTTTNKRNQLLEMFLDASGREAYAQGRLKTRRTEDGVELVAYHEHVLARVNIATDEITLFTGHYGAHSETVDKYISALGRLLNLREGFSVNVLEGHAPTTGHGYVAESGQYIGEYVNPWGQQSPAERNIVQSVNEALRSHL